MTFSMIGIILGLIIISFGFGMLTGVLYTVRKSRYIDEKRNKKTREYIENRKKYEMRFGLIGEERLYYEHNFDSKCICVDCENFREIKK